jgi:hypothetical protein
MNEKVVTKVAPNLKTVEIWIQADQAKIENDGAVKLIFRVPEMPHDTELLLKSLFPHTLERANDLLKEEIVLDSIIRPR